MRKGSSIKLEVTAWVYTPMITLSILYMHKDVTNKLTTLCLNRTLCLSDCVDFMDVIMGDTT